MATAGVLRGKSRESYLSRVADFPLMSIKSQRQLETAQRVVDQLLALPRRDQGTEAYLDALSDLVEAYEDDHHHIPPASDAEMLAHLMESKGISQSQLHNETGVSKSTISEVLAGRRTFSRGMIRRFAAYFDVETSVLAANL
jgi:HTH-type transcriptional regulator/antitoxin HigA